MAAFLNYKLTGKFATGWGIADPTGLFDMQENMWSSQLLNFLGLTQDQVPQAYPAGTIIGKVTHQSAQLCNLPEGLPVVAGLGDGQAAGLGANITQTRRTYLSLGTSVVTGTYTHNFITNQSFRTMYTAGDGYLLETVILGGTYTLDWLQEKMAPDISLAELETESRVIPPGSNGLIVVPYWNSVMNPYWDAAASGITVGWRGFHGLAHFYRAILEGIAYELRLHFEGLTKALESDKMQIFVMGGGAANELWCQIIADICGRTIQKSQNQEVTALGAGILGASGVKLFADIDSATRNMTHAPVQSYFPNAKHHAAYTHLYNLVYKPLFPTLQPILQQISSR